ncbi:hypothetical protein [Xanthomonas populi]|nr:hypothetical protein [Xanthomonas populi]
MRWLGMLFISSLGVAIGVDLAVNTVFLSLRMLSPGLMELHEAHR